MWLLIPLGLLGQILLFTCFPRTDSRADRDLPGLALAGLVAGLAAARPLHPGDPWGLAGLAARARLAPRPMGVGCLLGAWTMAAVVDRLTRSQLRRHLGALPALYALLEIMQVRTIINRYCPTEAEVDHGTVALVLIFNRLMAPRPLYTART